MKLIRDSRISFNLFWSILFIDSDGNQLRGITVNNGNFAQRTWQSISKFFSIRATPPDSLDLPDSSKHSLPEYAQRIVGRCAKVDQPVIRSQLIELFRRVDDWNQSEESGRFARRLDS